MSPLERFTGGNPRTRRKLNALVDRLNQLGQLRGDGSVLQVKTGVGGDQVIRVNYPELARRMPKGNGFWAKITDSDEADAPAKNRWLYGWEEVVKILDGYPVTPGTIDNWGTGGLMRSGTTVAKPAYNTIENMNNATNAHVEGNGVDPENVADVGTFAMMPCTTDNIVWMWEVRYVTGGNPSSEYWFSYENGVDGTC